MCVVFSSPLKNARLLLRPTLKPVDGFEAMVGAATKKWLRPGVGEVAPGSPASGSARPCRSTCQRSPASSVGWNGRGASALFSGAGAGLSAGSCAYSAAGAAASSVSQMQKNFINDPVEHKWAPSRQRNRERHGIVELRRVGSLMSRLRCAVRAARATARNASNMVSHCWPVMPDRKWSCAFFHLGSCARQPLAALGRQREPALALRPPRRWGRSSRGVRASFRLREIVVLSRRVPPADCRLARRPRARSAPSAARTAPPRAPCRRASDRRAASQRAPPDARSRTRRRIPSARPARRRRCGALRVTAGSASAAARAERAPCTRRSPGSPSTAAIDPSAPWRRRRWWRSG